MGSEHLAIVSYSPTLPNHSKKQSDSKIKEDLTICQTAHSSHRERVGVGGGGEKEVKAHWKPLSIHTLTQNVRHSEENEEPRAWLCDRLLSVQA